MEQEQKKEGGGQRTEEGAEALAVCPFCGSSSLEKRSFDDPAHYIRCNECGAGSGLYASEEKAVAGWNMRATSERIEFAEIVRHLKERGVITEADVAKLEEVAHVDYVCMHADACGIMHCPHREPHGASDCEADDGLHSCGQIMGCKEVRRAG